MRITAVETLHFSRSRRVRANEIPCLWVRLHTDAEVVGLGETYPMPEVEEAVIHEVLAPVILGTDPSGIERLWADMLKAVSLCGWAGAEMRAISAIDLALWDVAGKMAGLPIYKLLGGQCRSSLRIYNTCYDRIDFMQDPVRLARELFDAGIRAMKIWPFDVIAKENAGRFGPADRVRRGAEFITREQIDRGAAPLRKIKQEFGDSMSVAMEFHGCWNLQSAIQIAQVLEADTPLWLEEMLPQDNISAYRELAQATNLPLILSERLMTRYAFREVLESRAARIIMLDLSWCGGFTEGRKIAAIADTYYLPVSPHNCGGPVLHLASAHLAAHLTNFSILETVRGYYEDRYPNLVIQNLVPRNGELPLPEGPGMGVELSPALLSDDDLVSRITRENDL